MTKFLANKSIIFVFDLCDIVRTRVAFLEVILMKMTIEVIGICNGWFFGLIDRI